MKFLNFSIIFAFILTTNNIVTTKQLTHLVSKFDDLKTKRYFITLRLNNLLEMLTQIHKKSNTTFFKQSYTIEIPANEYSSQLKHPKIINLIKEINSTKNLTPLFSYAEEFYALKNFKDSYADEEFIKTLLMISHNLIIQNTTHNDQDELIMFNKAFNLTPFLILDYLDIYAEKLNLIFIKSFIQSSHFSYNHLDENTTLEEYGWFSPDTNSLVNANAVIKRFLQIRRLERYINFLNDLHTNNKELFIKNDNNYLLNEEYNFQHEKIKLCLDHMNNNHNFAPFFDYICFNFNNYKDLDNQIFFNEIVMIIFFAIKNYLSNELKITNDPIILTTLENLIEPYPIVNDQNDKSVLVYLDSVWDNLKSIVASNQKKSTRFTSIFNIISNIIF